jgi:hypothetical protein
LASAEPGSATPNLPTKLHPPSPSLASRAAWPKHRSGDRSGDKFCDRFVLPSLTPEQIDAVGTGRLPLDKLTRDRIHDRFAFRYIRTHSGDEARQLENEVKADAFQAVRPLLNPAR